MKSNLVHSTPNQSGGLASLAQLRMIRPLILSGLGSAPTQWVQLVWQVLTEIFAELGSDLPVGFRGLDSASGTAQTGVVLPGSTAAAGLCPSIRTYDRHDIASLREVAAANRNTRPLADTLARLPMSTQSADSEAGCAQLPQFGAACWLANYQLAHGTFESAFDDARNSGRIAACEAKGYRILEGTALPVLSVVNAAGSTGCGAEVKDAAMRKDYARSRGVMIENHALVLLPSLSKSANPENARINAGKLLLELALSVEHPDRICVNLLDGRTIRYADGPIFDSITLLSKDNSHVSAASRTDLIARLALFAAVCVTTPWLAASEQAFADSRPEMADRRGGLRAFRRLGWTRAFIDSATNAQIARQAIEAHLRVTL